MRAGKSSSINNNLAVDRLAHNPKVGGSNPPPATNNYSFRLRELRGFFIVPTLPPFWVHWVQQRD
jgi:hypothetical protein